MEYKAASVAPKPIKKPANTQTAGKRGGKTRTSWKPGQSGNPTGAPKRGQSWAEIVKEIGDLTGPEIAAKVGQWSQYMAGLPGDVTVKTLVVIRAYEALLKDPDPKLLIALMDRAEGKPIQPIGGPANDDADKFSAIKLQLISRLSKIASEPEAQNVSG